MSIRNRCRGPLSVICIACGALTAAAQGSFQNLDFESAIIPPNPDGFVAFSNGLPSWTGSLGPFPATEALYNGVSLGLAEVSIIDRTAEFYSNSVISGYFTGALSSGFAGTSFVSTSIFQTGMIPSVARSLQFDAQGVVSDLSVTFNGQAIPFFQIGTGSNFQVYGLDISTFAGQIGELRFTEQPISGNNTTVLLDDILFSPSTVPEPGVLGVLAMGAVVFGWGLKKKLKI